MSDKIYINKLAQDAATKAGVAYTDLCAFMHGYMLGHEDARVRIKVLEEALGFYANTDNWFNKWPHNRWNRIEKSDEEQSKTAPITIGGKRARAALRGE